MKRTKQITSLLVGVLFLLPILNISAQTFPKPKGYVSDFAGVIDESNINKMEQLISFIEKNSTVEIAVVTLDSIEPYATVNEAALALADQWQVGKKDVDNGIVFLLALKERQARIEVGYGIEGIIPDGLAGDILDTSVIPYFRQSEYGDGFLQGVAQMSQIIANEYNIDLSSFQISAPQKPTQSNSRGVGYYAFIVLFMVFFGGRRIIWPLLFMSTYRHRGHYGGGFGSRGSFGSSSGFGGGGFSGFGGGGFGGGGASRGF
jgi:uncharacterized protein